MMLRVFKEPNVPGRDPYVFSCSVVMVEEGVGELRGVAVSGFTQFAGMRDAVREEARRHGIKKLTWIRKNRGRVRRITMVVPEVSDGKPI